MHGRGEGACRKAPVPPSPDLRLELDDDDVHLPPRDGQRELFRRHPRGRCG
jgi:hypothetical protein